MASDIDLAKYLGEIRLRVWRATVQRREKPWRWTCVPLTEKMLDEKALKGEAISHSTT